MSIVEIIDLTTPPMPEPFDVDSVNGPIEESSEVPANQRSRRKRKRKSRKSTNDSPATTACPSSRNSPERQLDSEPQSKRKRSNHSRDRRSDEEDSYSGRKDDGENHKAEEQDLFFVDVTPTLIPPARQIVTEAHNEPAESSGKLLVPSHVTVLGSTPVEIRIQPLAESEDEDFINYLDYDDSKVSLLWRVSFAHILTRNDLSIHSGTTMKSPTRPLLSIEPFVKIVGQKGHTRLPHVQS